jgi:hypothetical protein
MDAKNPTAAEQKCYRVVKDVLGVLKKNEAKYAVDVEANKILFPTTMKPIQSSDLRNSVYRIVAPMMRMDPSTFAGTGEEKLKEKMMTAEILAVVNKANQSGSGEAPFQVDRWRKPKR